MSNRVDLSAHTHIEDMDGVRYLVTTRKGISVEWIEMYEGWTQYWNETFSEYMGCQSIESLFDADKWRILLTDVAPVYAYAEGEPWAQAENHIIICGLPFWDWSDRAGECTTTLEKVEAEELGLLHRRAAQVVATGETFRLFHGELREARDQ